MLSQTGDPIVFWVLRLVVLLSFFLSGYFISFKDKDGKSYWNYASICIIVYSLVEGLRWNRGVDYPHYYQDLTGKLFTDYSELVYVWWTDLFKFVGLPYWVGFVFYSFLFVLGFCYIMKLFRKQAVWALPLFFIITVGSSENLIRQFIAMSMFEFFLYFFWVKKYKKSIVFALLTLQTHTSVLLIVLAALTIHYMKFDRKIQSGYILVGVYLLFYYFWKPEYLAPFTMWLSSLSLGDSSNMTSYLENAEFWFSEDSSLSERLGYVSKAASFIATTVSLVTTCFIVKYGFDLTKKDSRFRIVYWFTFLSYILFILSSNGDFEIWSRLSIMFRFVSPLVIAGILTVVPLRKIEKIAIYSFFGVYFLYNSFFSMWGQSFLGSAFVWDR